MSLRRVAPLSGVVVVLTVVAFVPLRGKTPDIKASSTKIADLSSSATRRKRRRRSR